MAGVGGKPGAVAALTEALTLARPEGYVRIFADEGTPVEPLPGSGSCGTSFARSRCINCKASCLAPEPGERRDNPTADGPFWNAGSWEFAGS